VAVGRRGPSGAGNWVDGVGLGGSGKTAGDGDCDAIQSGTGCTRRELGH
jgi:hypothetical protein